MAAGRPLWAVQLHHPLAALGQQPGQPGAVAAGGFHRPHPDSGVPLGEGNQGLVAGRGGRDGLGGQDPAAGRGHHRGGVGVLVGVHADDDLDQICQDGHAYCSLPEGRGLVPVRLEHGRTVMGHTRLPRVVRLLISQQPRSAGAGSSKRTSPAQGITPVSVGVTPAATNTRPTITEPRRQSSQSVFTRRRHIGRSVDSTAAAPRDGTRPAHVRTWP
jgi:hypothetical protein